MVCVEPGAAPLLDRHLSGHFFNRSALAGQSESAPAQGTLAHGVIMTTTARGRIPRLICAACISSAFLVSAGAATAVAVTQSPAGVSVRAVPRDDSGGSDPGSASDGSGTPADNGGNGTGSDTADQPSTNTGDQQVTTTTKDEQGNTTTTTKDGNSAASSWQQVPDETGTPPPPGGFVSIGGIPPNSDSQTQPLKDDTQLGIGTALKGIIDTNPCDATTKFTDPVDAATCFGDAASGPWPKLTYDNPPPGPCVPPANDPAWQPPDECFVGGTH